MKRYAQAHGRDTTDEEIRGWFAGRVPDGWFTGNAHVRLDRDEVIVTGPVEEPVLEEGASDDARRAARVARVKRFREETREARIRIATEAEHLFGRKVSWGASVGDDEWLFTNLAVPVMTRLRMQERAVLDTLIDAGVARSRSEALAWCVRLVGRHQAEWIEQLREAVESVDRVRAEGPDLD
jgi:hypothetical protein